MDFRSFNPEFFGLTIDAFTTGSLIVDGFVEGCLPIKKHALESAFFPVEIFDTALSFEELRVVAGLASG